MFSPQKLGDDLQSGYEYGIKKVERLDDIDWSGRMPYGSWKEILLPHHERLFDIVKGKLIAVKQKYPPIACLGMNILDLRALTLFEQVFENDITYQKRRQKILIIGYSTGLPDDYKRYKVSSHEKALKNVVFDIFITKQKSGKLKIYAGSEKGQNKLEDYGISDYHNIEYGGPVPASGPSKKMLTLAKKMENSRDKKIWDELDKRCIACGKCVAACPTCFCFDMKDRDDPDDQSRVRKWGSCFYNDFSLVAGGHKDLDTVKKKIFFWYYHKFVRIPHQYSISGCVGCNRCTKACPVGIDIKKTLKAL